MGKEQPDRAQNKRFEQRGNIGTRFAKVRASIPKEEGQDQAALAAKLGLTNTLLSKIESGQASLPLESLDALAEELGVHPEEIWREDGRPDKGISPLDSAIGFLQQSRMLGVEGIYPERAGAFGHLLPFVMRMNSGTIEIVSSSMQGVEKQSDHPFVKRLLEMGKHRRFRFHIIFTHPRVSVMREHQEHRTSGSIVREIFAGLNWCLGVLGVPHQSIRLSLVGPSSFCIFLNDGPEGLGAVNPYPTMRQALSSFALAVRKVDALQQMNQATSIYQVYREANFTNPWTDPEMTVALLSGLKGYRSEEGGRDSDLKGMLDRAIEACEKQGSLGT